MTGFLTQCWVADEAPTGDGQIYESVKCAACTRMHLVCRATGKSLDQRRE